MPPSSSPQESTSESREKRTRNALASSEKSSSSQKPHKGNSEARKLQNRIASKNYREKRKRKLEYLQQLLESQSPHGRSPAVSPSGSLEDGFSDRSCSLSGEQRTLARLPDPVRTHPSELGPPMLVSSGATPGLVGSHSAFDELVSVCQGSFENLEPVWPSPSFVGSSSQGSDSITASFDEAWFPEISDFTNDGDFQFQPSAQSQQPLDHVSELPIHTIGMVSSGPLLPTTMGQSLASAAVSQSFLNVGASASLQIYDPRGREVQNTFKKLSIQYSGLPLEKKQQLIKTVHAHGFKFLDAIRSFIENDGLSVFESNSYSTTRSSPNSGKRRANLPRSSESKAGLAIDTYQRSPLTLKVADLHVNNFRIHQISFFAAVFANARALGFRVRGLSR